MPKSYDDKKRKSSKEIASSHTLSGNGRRVSELAERLTELQKSNQEIREARRAALNMMEDALLSKKALLESESRLARELEDTKQLQQVSSALIEEENIDLLFEKIMDAAQAIMHADAASMQVFVPEKNALRLLAWKGFNPESAAYWEWVAADSGSTCGTALEKNERIIVPDIETCEFMKGTEDIKFYRLSKIYAVQSTPLISRSGEIVGMLSTHWTKIHHPSQRELNFIDVLARQAADLMERRSVEEALRKSEERYRTKLEQDVRERSAELAANKELLQATMDASMDIIQVFKAVRNEQNEIVDFRYVLINHEAEKWMPGALGKSLLQVQPGVVKEGIFDAFKKVVETGIPDQREHHYVHEQFNGWFFQSVVKLDDGVATTTTDITKRKEAEREVKRTKEFLQATLNSTLYVIQAFSAVRDKTGKIIDFVWTMNNQKGIEQNGDVIGKSLLTLNPGVGATGLFERFVQVTETGVPVDHEVFYDYEQFSGWFHQILVKLDDGFVMSTEDITSRKKAEQELKESKDLVQTVFDISLNPIAYHKAVRNVSGKIVDFEFQLENQEARKYAEEDRTGKKYSEAYPGIKDTEVFNLYCNVVETGKELNQEVRLNLKGKDRWFHLTGVKLDDGLVATALDITERKNAESEILRLKDEVAQKATDRYLNLFNAIDTGFCIIEVVFDKKGKATDYVFLETNPAFVKQTSMENVVGKTMRSLAPQHEEFWYETYGEISKTGEPKRFEHFASQISGGVWYDVYAFRLYETGDNHVAILFSDITERKRNEQNQVFLLRFSDQLRAKSTADAVANGALEMLIEELKLDRSYITSYHLDENRADLDYQIGNDTVPPLPDHFVLSDYPEALKATFEGPLVINDELERKGLSEDEKRNSGKLRMRSMVAVTLHKNEKVHWSMIAINSYPRRWASAEIKLIEEVSERTWTALERAKAEEALKKSEEKFRTLFESIDEGFCIIDMMYDDAGKAFDYRIIESNEMHGKLTGSGNVLNKLGSELSPNEEPGWIEMYDKVVKTGEPVRFENYHADTSGWYTGYISRVGGEGSRQLAMVFNNITERKLREEQQAFLNEISKDLVEINNINDTIQLLGEKIANQFHAPWCNFAEMTRASETGVVISGWNSAAVSSVKGIHKMRDLWTEEQILKNNAGQLTIVNDTQNDSHVNAENYAALNMRSFITVPLARNGEFKFMLAIADNKPRVWRDDEIALVKELTTRIWVRLEKAKAEEALRQRERELARVQEIGNIGGVYIDVANKLTGHRSPEYLRLHGLPPDIKSETHEDWLARVHPDDREKAEKVLFDALKGSQSNYENEYRIIRLNDKQVCWIYAKMDIERDEQGNPLRIAGVHIDITRRKAAEEALHESEERKAFVLKLSDALRLLNDPAEIQLMAAQLTGEYLHVNLVHYAETNGDYVTIRRAWSNGVNPIIGMVRHEDYGKALIEGLRAGEIEICYDVNADATISKEERKVLHASNILAYIAVPLTKDGEWVATLAVHTSQPRNWKAAEIELVRDIAERTWLAVESVEAEEALRSSEEQFRRTIENAPVPVIMYAETGEVLQLSRAFIEMTGLTRLQIPTFDHWLKFIFGKGARKLHGHTKNLRWQEKLRLNTEISVMTKTGESRFWNFTVSSPGSLTDGRRFLVGMAIDITDRKTVEDALRKSESRFRVLADAVPQIIWANDAKGKANYFNRRWYDYSGLAFEQSVGLGWETIVHPDDEPSSVEKWKKALAAGEIFDVEYRLRRQDGQYRWHIGRNVPLKDDYDKVTGWFGSATDIDDLKKTQEALSQSEARLRITMESASDYAIITMDTERKIERWSNGAAKIFGYTETEVKGQLADLIFTEEDRQAGAPQKEVDTARNTGRASDERWHKRKDGTRFFMSGVMAPIYDGTLTGYVKVARDMTPQKLLEQQKDEFIGIASHELKTPVTSIKAYTELLKDMLDEQGNQEDVQLVTKLDTQVDRLAELIRSLLDTTRIAEGQLRFDQEAFDINALIKERVEEMQHTTDNHRLVFNSTGALTITGDRERIGQVLINLVSNAIKYSPKGGDVTINSTQTKDGVQVSVQDTGVGIPADTKDKIFDRFYRVRNAQIDTFPGMGLGLYITAAIVKRHGGNIWVESELNKGSTFYFFLPYGEFKQENTTDIS